ncbi:chemotaxis protein CheD [Pararhizobium mangrovi]|uniref:Probable chemoreceptor glutamine deamidase CheD n=1 Tax=Pararhizobium mangrovi TaxID=2590452 RepID=A0A506UB49_9HYPH|nr:chemotaxis protein CheD [Pararhizobium mangrovi]TPW29027.1 chemotaxis protein CheD [Pararhizobium mangrovi]
MIASVPKNRITVLQGEVQVAGDPQTVLTTLLGSCVAACVRDPHAGIGGMNHFLVPGTDRGRGGHVESYGLFLMELLINTLLKQGARRERLEAKLFGGGQVVDGLGNIGMKNAAFAERFLQMERITYLGGSLGGVTGRRVEYWPATGRVRQLLMDARQVERQAPKPRVPAVADLGEVELF